MTDKDTQSTFHTFVIDAWNEVNTSQHDRTWRFRVRDIRNNKHYVFPTVEAMLDYLSNQFESNHKLD